MADEIDRFSRVHEEYGQMMPIYITFAHKEQLENTTGRIWAKPIQFKKKPDVEHCIKTSVPEMAVKGTTVRPAYYEPELVLEWCQTQKIPLK